MSQEVELEDALYLSQGKETTGSMSISQENEEGALYLSQENSPTLSPFSRRRSRRERHVMLYPTSGAGWYQWELGDEASSFYP